MRDGSANTSMPRTRTRPAWGRSIPINMRIVVLLPAPFGPIKPKVWPRGMCSVRSSTAVALPYRRVTPVNSMARSFIVFAIIAALALSAGPCQRRVEHCPNAFGRQTGVLSCLHALLKNVQHFPFRLAAYGTQVTISDEEPDAAPGHDRPLTL